MSKTQVLAPVAGRAVALEDVPDPVFSQGMVGYGAAVDPPRAVVEAVAPVGGKLLKLMPHAYIVLTPEGVGVLVSTPSRWRAKGSPPTLPKAMTSPRASSSSPMTCLPSRPRGSTRSSPSS